MQANYLQSGFIHAIQNHKRCLVVVHLGALHDSSPDVLNGVQKSTFLARCSQAQKTEQICIIKEGQDQHRSGYLFQSVPQLLFLIQQFQSYILCYIFFQADPDAMPPQEMMLHQSLTTVLFLKPLKSSTERVCKRFLLSYFLSLPNMENTVTLCHSV